MKQTLFKLGHTDRLLVRAPQEGDLEAIGTLWTDPAVTRFIGGPRERAPVVAHFSAYAADPETLLRDEGDRWWSIVERASGAFAGLCCLLQKEVAGREEVELAYFMLPAYWGQGYATEAARLAIAYAFVELGLDSLVSVIDPQNSASSAVAHKLGMHLEREMPRSDGVTRQIYRLKRET